MSYLLAHWRGAQGLAWSFWVNLVVLRAGLFAIQDAALPLADASLLAHRIAVLVFALLAHGIVLVWQVVGVVRACDAHLRGLGSMAHVWGAQLGIILVALHSAVGVLHAWQTAVPGENDGDAHVRTLAERATRYRLESSADGRWTRLSGTLELGVAKALRDHLERHPDTRTVVLESPGGNVHEARGLARVIRDRALDTLVEKRCSSACTIAFIGGGRRFLVRDARLGFHRYRLDASYPVLLADPAASERRDRELYASAGVAADFVARMFDADPTSLWEPSLAELLEAGVVTDTAERGAGAPSR